MKNKFFLHLIFSFLIPAQLLSYYENNWIRTSSPQDVHLKLKDVLPNAEDNNLLYVEILRRNSLPKESLIREVFALNPNEQYAFELTNEYVKRINAHKILLERKDTPICVETPCNFSAMRSDKSSQDFLKLLDLYETNEDSPPFEVIIQSYWLKRLNHGAPLNHITWISFLRNTHYQLLNEKQISTLIQNTFIRLTGLPIKNSKRMEEIEKQVKKAMENHLALRNNSENSSPFYSQAQDFIPSLLEFIKIIEFVTLFSPEFLME